MFWIKTTHLFKCLCARSKLPISVFSSRFMYFLPVFLLSGMDNSPWTSHPRRQPGDGVHRRPSPPWPDLLLLTRQRAASNGRSNASGLFISGKHRTRWRPIPYYCFSWASEPQNVSNFLFSITPKSNFHLALETFV